MQPIMVSVMLLGLSAVPASAQVMLNTLAQGNPVSMPHAESVRSLSVSFNQTVLADAVKYVIERSGLPVMYSGKKLPAARITYRAEGVAPETVLRAVLLGSGFALERAADGTLAIIPQREGTRQGTITGKVIHAKTKQPIAGASISITPSTPGTVTAEDGTFRIVAEEGAHTVIIRAVGFTRMTQRVTVTPGQATVIEVVMEPNANVLDQVVVTGTVVATERKTIPTPITVVSAAEIERRGITRVEDLFRGSVPGVLALERGVDVYQGEPGKMQTSTVLARGTGTLGNTTNVPVANPLKTYVDGVELEDPAYLGTIDVKSIERVEIVVGPQAATIYGSGASGGVMQIFTKQGTGLTAPDVTLGLQYGMLESNVSTGRAPVHTHSISALGGNGPRFSYSSTLTYRYSGQWRPALYARTFSASAGASTRQGPVTASLNGSTSIGSNGVWVNSPLESQLRESGIRPPSATPPSVPQVNKSTSQTIGLRVDYSVNSRWQHHLDMGNNRNDFTIDPESPTFATPSDTLYRTRIRNGRRLTAGYNTTFTVPAFAFVSQVLTVGANGNTGNMQSIDGCVVTKSASQFIPCPLGSIFGIPLQAFNMSSQDDESWGMFGTYRLGIADQFFLTAAFRGERNPNYGRSRRVNWTPRYGATYTLETGLVSIKVLASAGNATRAPRPGQRDEQWTTIAGGDPDRAIIQIANPELGPEYSLGPQGGLELYWGNRGSVTVNRYVQLVRDLIQTAQVDSFEYKQLSTGDIRYLSQSQSLNTATIRQHGWEGTGSLNIWRFSLQSTWSWMDSRVRSVNPRAQGNTGFWRAGDMFQSVPTHNGNVTISYVYGATSATVTTNMVGAARRGGSDNVNLWNYHSSDRLVMYVQNRLAGSPVFSRPGYAKSNLVISHRIRPGVSLTMNMNNLANSFGSEATYVTTPTLGRQTTFGMTLKIPQVR